jgi:hypothetical protein
MGIEEEATTLFATVKHQHRPPNCTHAFRPAPGAAIGAGATVRSGLSWLRWRLRGKQGSIQLARVEPEPGTIRAPVHLDGASSLRPHGRRAGWALHSGGRDGNLLDLSLLCNALHMCCGRGGGASAATQKASSTGRARAAPTPAADSSPCACYTALQCKINRPAPAALMGEHVIASRPCGRRAPEPRLRSRGGSGSEAPHRSVLCPRRRSNIESRAPRMASLVASGGAV